MEVIVAELRLPEDSAVASSMIYLFGATLTALIKNNALTAMDIRNICVLSRAGAAQDFGEDSDAVRIIENLHEGLSKIIATVSSADPQGSTPH